MILAIGIFIFIQNRKSLVNFSFFMICLCVTLWLFSISFVYAARTSETAIRIYRTFTFLGVAYIAPSVYTFSVLWLNLYARQRLYVLGAFAGAAIFYLFGVFTPYGFDGAYEYYWGHYPMYGMTSRIFLAFFFSYFFLAFANFMRAYLKEPKGIRRTQIGLIAFAFLISFLGSVDYVSKLVRIAVYPVGYLCVFTWIMTVAYAIVRYKVMDIQTVIHKTIMWLFTPLVVGSPLIFFIYFRRDWLFHLHPIAFLSFVASTFVLYALYARYVQPRIDHLFQRRQWDLNLVLERFTDELVHLKDLDQVATHILNTVKNVFYVPNVSLLVRRGDTDNFTVMDPAHEKPTLQYDMQNSFFKWLSANDMVVIAEYVTIDPRLGEVAETAKAYFESLGAKISVPMVVNQKLVGVLNIGAKQNLQPFRSPEIAFLADLRRSAAIALSNSLHLIAMQENLRKWNIELEKKVEERTRQLKEMQAQLVQAEKMATMGTMAGGIAHEINNPLTAVLTNAQILKMDAKEEDLESITLIEEGAKRCQEIIQKIMKYARKPLGPETVGMVSLKNVVTNAVAFLEYQLKQDNIELILQTAGDLPAISGNGNELEQVVTNLVLNAKDAVKQTHRSGRISIETFEKKNVVGFHVVDNGYGIPKEHLNKIFDPFFTTKEIGKGTGLGLAVTYGIVEKHKGKIDVDSKIGEGTRFTVELPKG